MRSCRSVATTFALYALSSATILGLGCFGSGPPLIDTSDDAGGSSTDLNDAAGLPHSDVDLGDSFALEGIQPSHGPFTGGTRVTLGGRGFSSHLHVFLGATEVPAASILASDPTRAAIVTPPGPPGLVDVRIKDDQTAKERVLKGAFGYDAFVVVPNTGATSGGTRVRLTNGDPANARWGTTPTIAIGGVPCTDVGGGVSGPNAETIDCTTPASAQGSKDVTITTSSGQAIQVRDAFTYSDSPDGFRGGLTGGALSGRVRVLAYDGFTGTPIADAYVIAGDSLATGIVQQTAPSGVTEINGITGTAVTVTIAAKCHQPVTFVAVPVDTVTAYLNPTLDPKCASGDPPSTGGGGGLFGGVVEGQLVFPGAGEFQRAGWSTVPPPTKPTERRAAYVFEAAPGPGGGFQLPTAGEAITPEGAGSTGYSYSIVVFPGNSTVYAVAGLEDRSVDPPSFVPYSMGVARGITVPAQTRVTGVDLKMDILFDHEVTVAPQPPAPGPHGPDRIQTSYALTLGAAGYAILPLATRTAPLPAPATMPFVGVPSLDHAITGEEYVLGGVAATGVDLLRPASVVARVRTTDANLPVSLGGFLGVPVLDQPGAGAWNGTHVQFSGASGPVDLTLVVVSSGAGLVSWTIVAPSAETSFDLPDPNGLPSSDKLGLLPGGISTTVYVARIDQFSYGSLRYGNLSQGSWNAFAFDSAGGIY